MSFNIPRYSLAFEEYCQNRRQVRDLIELAPSEVEQLRSTRKRDLANALFCGSVVLLSAHLERYIEAVVVEAIDSINKASPPTIRIPEPLRMVQIEDEFGEALKNLQDNRKGAMMRFKTSVSTFPWIWNDGDPCGRIDGKYLIGDNRFSNPSPRKINAVFGYFAIDRAVGKSLSLYKRPDRQQIEEKTAELVRKRNDIAHTGNTPSLTRQDVTQYLVWSRRLVRGLDIVIGKKVEQIVNRWPWE